MERKENIIVRTSKAVDVVGMFGGTIAGFAGIPFGFTVAAGSAATYWLANRAQEQLDKSKL